MLNINIKPKLIRLVVAMLLVGATQGNSQTTVSVDPSKKWVGYMNVFELSNAYVFGSTWGTADLCAVFTSTNYLTLSPNSINDPNPFWYTPSGGPGATGNKIMDASFYVQDDTLAGQNLVFSGTCLTNTFVAGYTCRAFIKEFAPDYSWNIPVTVDLVAGQAFTLGLPTTAGMHIQYGFETVGPDVWVTDAPSKGFAVVAVNTLDPNLPDIVGQVLAEGQNATFSAAPKGTAPFTYEWSFSDATTTTVLSDGGRISGATTASLTISNLVQTDAGTYSVKVTNSKGSAMTSSSLAVVPLAQVRTNMLNDPGFEASSFAPSPDVGWANFNGSVLQGTNDFYYQSTTPVAVIEGGRCFETYSTGSNSYNGCYQFRPALPGQVYTGDAWFLTPSADLIKGAGQCWLEVQFQNAAGNIITLYKSALVTSNSPADTWMHMQPTNIIGPDLVTPIGTSSVMIAPAGRVRICYQVTYHADAGGSIYVDGANLRLRAPVAVPSASAGKMQVAFPTLYGPTYQILYKTSLMDSQWKLLKTVSGDGTPKTVLDPQVDANRFYIVNTQ